ncbi:hypothetical protein ACOMHN_067075 [Nucella lapillus]
MVVLGETRGRGCGGAGNGDGGGGGGGGGGSSGVGVEEGKVCSVAWQRQHLHHQHLNTKTSIKQAAQGGETLPVVELKPFTKKVWRREKSLPNFYEKPAIKAEDLVSETARNARNNTGAHPDIVRYIRELSDQQKTVDTRQSADSTHHYRSKLHPKAEFSFEGWSIAEHQQDLIPSFISRQNRTKTSLAEDSAAAAVATAAPATTTTTTTTSGGAGGGSNVGNVSDRSTGGGGGGLGREVSNLMSTYTRDKPLQQQQGVCLTGDKLSMANLGRRQLTYLNPFSAYRQRQPWSALRSEPPNTAGLSPRHVSVANSGRAGGPLAASANGHPLPTRRDLVLSGSSFYHPDRTPLQPLKARHSSSPHKFNSKLGAAQDALLMLSRSGVPTVVERNLCFDQEVRLERCRREKSFAAVSETNIMSTTHYVAYDTQPTRGEINLMRAREANKLPEGAKATIRRNGLQKPIGPLPPFGSNHSNITYRQMFDDSPRSVQSDAGDSGTRSSPEDGRDVTAGDDHNDGPVVVIPWEETIPEDPADFEKPGGPSGERQGNGLHDSWAQQDSLVMLQVPGEDVAESAEEYQRPLSDSAATEAVHVRNELTPMSAENRPCLLPRDDSYLETVNSEREISPHRKHREGFVTDARPSHGAGNVSDGQERDQSGAETSTNDSSTRKQTDAVMYSHHAAQTESDQERNHTVQERDGGSKPVRFAAEEREATTQTDNNIESPAAEDAVFRVVRPGSGAGGRVGTHASNQAGSEGTTAGIPQAAGHHVMELLSVNSSAHSQGNLDSAHGPISQSPSQTALPEDGQKAGAEDAEAFSNAEMEVDTEPEKVSEMEVDTEPEKVSENKPPEENTPEVKSTDVESQKVKSEEDVENPPVPQKNSHPPTPPSNGSSKDNAKDDPVQSEDGSKNVETIVTVTMETVSNGDNFDGTKTFLTATNVESEEWQNMVKV